MTVGPLPFGGIPDRTVEDWPDWKPDVIYAGLNWRAIPLAHAVLQRAASLGVPVAWHLKEAPHRALERGDWPLLAELWERADARILASGLERDLLEAWLPGRADPEATHVLDGDLPAAHWLGAGRPGPRAPVRGRRRGAHRALRAPVRHGSRVGRRALGGRRAPARPRRPLPEALRRAGGARVHEHPPVERPDWVRVLSAYDAGWLHPHASANGGEARMATWDDCNLPGPRPDLPRRRRAAPGRRQPRPPDRRGRARRPDRRGRPARRPRRRGRRLAAGAGTAARERAWAVREELTFDAHAGWLAGLLRELAAPA
jgi:hypothetical protein